MKMHTTSIATLSLIAAACAGDANGPGPQHGTTVSAAQIAAFDVSAGQLPEGVAIKDRFAYVGFAPLGQIAKVDLRSGTSTAFANLPKPVPSKGFMTGLAFGPDGDLYAALVSFDPSVQAGIYRVSASGGEATLFAKDPHMAFPNGLLFDAEDALFVTDSAAGTIFKIARDGKVSTWATSPLLAGDPSACGGSGNPFPIGANGLGEVDGALYVTNTDKGSIVRIVVGSDGSARNPEVASGPDCAALAGADGLTADENGDLIVALNRQNKIVRVASAGEPMVVLVEGAPADFPASLAWDGTTLVATNFALANASSGKSAKPGLLALASQD